MRTFSIHRLALTGAALTVALAASGCGTTTSSSGGGTDTTAGSDTAADTATTDTATGDTATTDTATTDTAAGDTTAAVSFAKIYPNLQTSCATASCHSTANKQFAGKLDMSSQSIAYAALVTAASADNICGPMLRVKPGDHANSTMWVRMSPTATGCGTGTVEKMPFGLAALPQAQIDAVAAWIDAGAAE